MMNNLAKEYQSIRVSSGVEDASPHRLIQMLMEGFIDRVASAKGNMTQGNLAEKGMLISKAIEIARGLKASLDMDRGGEISAQLEELYDYIIRRCLIANRENDPNILDEVMRLMSTIKQGWDGIPMDIREQYKNGKLVMDQGD